MFRIILCDDDDTDREELVQYIGRYFFIHNEIEAEIESFSDSGELQKVLNEKKADAYFLDVLMPGVNGIELGRMIRRKNEEVPIVYITASREYAFDAFDVRAYHYLEKPISQTAVSGILQELLEQYEKRKKQQVMIRTKDGIQTADMDRIVYVENISRCPVYFMQDGSRITGVCNRGTFEDSIHPLEEEETFIQPHKSFFVNMRYIRTMQNDVLVLDNEKKIAVSRRRMSQIRRKFLKYLGGSEHE